MRVIRGDNEENRNALRVPVHQMPARTSICGPRTRAQAKRPFRATFQPVSRGVTPSGAACDCVHHILNLVGRKGQGQRDKAPGNKIEEKGRALSLAIELSLSLLFYS